MAEKSRKNRSRTHRGVKKTPWASRALASLSRIDLKQLALLLVAALAATALVSGLEFQSIPDYRVGDIAHKTIKALQEFTVEDEEATNLKRDEALRRVPVVFELDLRINNRLATEIRSAFGNARRLIAEEKNTLGLSSEDPIPEASRPRLLQELRGAVDGPSRDRVLEICLNRSFSAELENEIVGLLRTGLARPGVILTRDLLVRYEERGIRIRNSITGQIEPLKQPATVRALPEARAQLRTLQDQLTTLAENEREPVATFVESRLVPNLVFDESETRKLEMAARNEVDPVLIQVKKGRVIVREGDEITEPNLLLLTALQQDKGPGQAVSRFVGIFILISLLQIVLQRYIVISRKRLRPHVNYFLLVILVHVTTLVVVKAECVLSDLVSTGISFQALQDPSLFYLLAPFSLGAILIVLLATIHLSIVFSLVFSVTVALMTGDLEIFIYALNGCLAAVYVLNQYRERSAITRAGLFIGAMNAVSVIAFQLYRGVEAFQWDALGWAVFFGLLSGLIAAMMASLFLPVLESIFGITTDIRLLELSNLNTPILRRLAIEAPGTYHHSIIVGTLAESAAEAIGANALLVRVGAYYHDIGKLKKPEYYAENQIFEGNKHETLSPSMSSLILASHVKDGLALSEEIKLAKEVRDMIPEHHGTRLMTFFYRKAVDAADAKSPQVQEEHYRYPGPKPQSKEAAILMISDQVEAASRTLQDPSPGQVRSMIKRLVQSTIKDGQFDECDITVKELDRITRALERVIVGMNHHRIEYPGFDFNTPKQPVSIESQRLQ